MPAPTRHRIIESARRLFWEDGYEATSLSRVASHAGVLPGSIYHFFPRKADLLEGVVEHYETELRRWLLDPVFARTTDSLERVYGVIATYREFLVATDFSLGCPVGGLALELGDDHQSSRARIRRIFAELRKALADCLARILDSGGPEAEPMADLVLTVIEGGIVQARAAGSIEPFDRSVECLVDYLGRRTRD